MASKWVDNDEYFGPDRRARRAMRLRERRHDDETGQQPSLGATLRRLRVLLANPVKEDAQHRARSLIDAAIAMAQTAQIHQCVAALRRADALLHARPNDFAAVEPVVCEAMNYL